MLGQKVLDVRGTSFQRKRLTSFCTSAGSIVKSIVKSVVPLETFINSLSLSLSLSLSVRERIQYVCAYAYAS